MAQPTTGVLFSGSFPPASPGNQLALPQTNGGQPAQFVTFQPQAATASLLGVVKPDGTTTTVDADGTIHAVGGTGSGGTSASGGAYICVVPSGAKDGSNRQYIIPAPVLAGTGYFYVRNGVMQRQLGTKAEFGVQGSTITTVTPLQSDDWHEFYYVMGTPNSESGGGGSVTPATTRGFAALTSSGGASSFVVPFPAGSQAGDMAVLFCANSGNNGGFGGPAAVPSGWTTLSSGGQTGSTTSWIGFAASKILTSGDISTGSVTVDTHGPGFAANSAVAAGIVTFVGPTNGIREGDTKLTSDPITVPNVVATSSAVLSTDIGLFFGCSAVPTGGATISVSPGTVLQAASNSDAMDVLAIANMPAGVSSIGFTRTGGAYQGAADFVVIVKP